MAGKRRRQTEGPDVSDDEQDGKRTRVSPDGGNQGWRNPKKIQTSKGRVAAKDYEVAVQEILKIAIGLFRSRLTAENAYPDRISQVSWAKEAWVEACKECEAQINFNNEVIQLARSLVVLISWMTQLLWPRFQITNRTWHLTSELKSKIRPLVEVMYGFESSAKSAVKDRNRKLVEDLTEDFGFCYKVPSISCFDHVTDHHRCDTVPWRPRQRCSSQRPIRAQDHPESRQHRLLQGQEG
jgi:hypothetical protein